MQAQYDRRAKELEGKVSAESSRRREEAETVLAGVVATCGDVIADKIHDLNAIKGCISGGLEIYMFCDDYDANKLSQLEMAGLMALADWVRSNEAVAVYLDGTTAYGFFICKACSTVPTVLVGMPRREIERLRFPVPTRKLPRIAKKFIERKVFQSIPED